MEKTADEMFNDLGFKKSFPRCNDSVYEKGRIMIEIWSTGDCAFYEDNEPTWGTKDEILACAKRIEEMEANK